MLPKSVNLPKRPFSSEICKESFTAKKYLDSHVRWKHDSDTNFKSKPVSTPRCTENEEMPNNTDRSTVVLDELDVVDTKKARSYKT